MTYNEQDDLKVMTFYSKHELDLEDEINDFFEWNQIEVLDIQYSSILDETTSFVCLILFKESLEKIDYKVRILESKYLSGFKDKINDFLSQNDGSILKNCFSMGSSISFLSYSMLFLYTTDIVKRKRKVKS